MRTSCRRIRALLIVVGIVAGAIAVTGATTDTELTTSPCSAGCAGMPRQQDGVGRFTCSVERISDAIDASCDDEPPNAIAGHTGMETSVTPRSAAPNQFFIQMMMPYRHRMVKTN